VKWIGTTGITITCNTTGRAGASATFTLNMASPQAGDKVTLWYQNQSFISPAIIAGNPTTDQALWWQGSVATTDQSPVVAGERGLQPLGKDWLGHVLLP